MTRSLPEQNNSARFSRRDALRGASALLLGCASAPKLQPGELVALLQSEPEHIDPRYASDALGSMLSRLVYRGLLEADPHTFSPVPALAERTELVDRTTVRAVLREGNRFHDGSPVTADDVVATYRAVLDERLRSTLRGTYARVFRSIHAENPRSVLFELQGPDGTHPSLLQLGILRARDASLPELLATEIPANRFVGSGPVRLRSASRGAWELERIAAPEHSSEPRALKFLTVRDPNTLALRLLHGGADVAEVKPELFPLFRNRPGFLLRGARGAGLTYLGLRNDHPVLAHREIRQALAHALNREALRQGKFGAFAQPATSLLPAGHWAHEPSVPTYPYDPDRARSLVRQVFGSRTPPSLVLRCNAVRFSLVLATAIAAMLRSVGFDVAVRPSDISSLLSDLRAGRFDMGLLTMPDLADPWGISWLLSTASIPTPANPRAGGNRWRFSNAAFDTACEEGRAAYGVTARRPHYALAQRIFSEELPLIPLWHPDVVFAAGPRVQNLHPRGDAQFDFLLRIQLAT